MYRAGPNQGKGLYRAGQGIIKKSLMPPHPLTNQDLMVCFQEITYQKQ